MLKFARTAAFAVGLATAATTAHAQTYYYPGTPYSAYPSYGSSYTYYYPGYGYYYSGYPTYYTGYPTYRWYMGSP